MIQLTISVGLSAMQACDADGYTALGRADQALYRAKGSGRDRVERVG